jgi:CRISPR-associated endonuclease/helicase Cas3
MREVMKPPVVPSSLLSTESANAFFTLLSGLASVADWIGSMEDYFEPGSGYVNLAEYVERAARQARRALKETGWLGWQPPTSTIPFESLCNVPAPRPLQETVISLVSQLDRPALVIIEAPTGVGKTEAALYLADHWGRVLHQRGTYMAMPTMATSNQMFKRVREVLKRRYPDELVNYHLLHGNAMLMDDDQLPRLATISDSEGRGTVAALTWFTKRKRGLLAPFAVGTVDQALMSILQTSHFFIRLFGLSHKTVIFDEIHAYDTYMEELFYLLLKWLRVMGTSVVVLSATLPEQSRRRLIQAYTGHPRADLPATSYPILTWATEDQIDAIPLEAPVKRKVALKRIERKPETIVRQLANELQDGGCAAVICNTVGRAQEIYRSVREAKIISEGDLILFHARFPFAWREQIEQEVLDLFKKGGKRPQKSIVVATQVIEQSLDLDFDLMISDLAPVDLVIQRVGRLHRHDSNRDTRPARLATPRLLLAMPETLEGAPRFDRGDVYIYGQYLMLRSYLTLRHRDSIVTPDETQVLIESVYGPENLLPKPLSTAMQQALDKARKAMEKRERSTRIEADSKLIPPPNDKYLLERSNACLDEDNPELHKYRRAATRLAPPSITLICLHRSSRGLALDRSPDSLLVDLNQKPDWEATKALFSRKIDTSDYRLVKYFADQCVPAKWEKNAWLRHAHPVIFKDGCCYPEGVSFYLELDPKLGLMVKEE